MMSTEGCKYLWPALENARQYPDHVWVLSQRAHGSSSVSCLTLSHVPPGCRRAAAWHRKEGRAWSHVLAGSPSRHRKCLVVEVEGGWVTGYRHSLPHSLTPSPTTTPPFSSSPQSISNAFLQSNNKRSNSISSTVRPCEISFASPGLCGL